MNDTETLDRLYLEWSQFTSARNKREIDLHDDVSRLERGIATIQEYLEATPPRIGDALFSCEALLAK